MSSGQEEKKIIYVGDDDVAEIEKCFATIQGQQSSYEKRQRRLNNQEQLIVKQEGEIKIMQDQKSQLEKKIKLLAAQNKAIKERLIEKKSNSDVEAMHCNLAERVSAHKRDLTDIYNKFIMMMLDSLRRNLNDLLICSSDKIITDNDDTREIYKVYGLLLSGCDLQKKRPTSARVDEVLSHVCDKFKIAENALIKKYTEDAAILTHNMLTLLPPLIVTVHPQDYREQLLDTNRSTWKDDCSMSLIYYRPILVYGNRLNVAVKGLVGNIDMESDHLSTMNVMKDAQSSGKSSHTIKQLGSSQASKKQSVSSEVSSYKANEHVAKFISSPCIVCKKLSETWKSLGNYQISLHEKCCKCKHCESKDVSVFWNQLLCERHTDKLLCPKCQKNYVKTTSSTYYCAKCGPIS